MEAPKTIHDFGGFPQRCMTPITQPGSPELAQHLVDLLAPVPVALDKEAWGFDHGLRRTDQDVPECRHPDGAVKHR
jgi:4,5-DOPA dioxygenase extradiol